MDKLKKFNLENDYHLVSDDFEKYTVSKTVDSNLTWYTENYLTASYYVRHQPSKIGSGAVEDDGKLDDAFVPQEPQEPMPTLMSLRSINDDSYYSYESDYDDSVLVVSEKEENTNTEEEKDNPLDDPNAKPPRPEENGGNMDRLGILQEDKSSKVTDTQNVTLFAEEYNIQTLSLYSVAPLLIVDDNIDNGDSEDNGINGSGETSDSEEERVSNYTEETNDYVIDYNSAEFFFEFEEDKFGAIKFTESLPYLDKPILSFKFKLPEGYKVTTDTSLLMWHINPDYNNGDDSNIDTYAAWQPNMPIMYDGYWVLKGNSGIFTEDGNTFEMSLNHIDQYINSIIESGNKVFFTIADNSSIEQYWTMKDFTLIIDDVYTQNIKMHEYALYNLKLIGNGFNMNNVKQVFVNGEQVSFNSNYVAVYGDGNFDVKMTFSTKIFDTLEGLFNGVEMLRTINFKHFKIKNQVTSTAEMFAGCHSLIKIEHFENIDTSKVTNMSAMFYQCFQLASDYMYYNAGNTSYLTDEETTFDANFLNVESVEFMDYMFCECHFRYIDTSTWKTPNLKSISGMFISQELKAIDFSNWDMSNVEYMHGVFSDNLSLKEVNWTCPINENFTFMSFVRTTAGYESDLFLMSKGVLIYDVNTMNDEILNSFISCEWLTLEKEEYFTIKLKVVEDGEYLTEGYITLDGNQMTYIDEYWTCQVKSNKFDFEIKYKEYSEKIKFDTNIILFGDKNITYDDYDFIATIDVLPNMPYVVINHIYVKDISFMVVDGKQIDPTNIIYFETSGEHTIQIKLDNYVINLSSIFNNSDIKTITITTRLNLSNVSTLTNMFMNARNLTSVIFEENDYSNIVSIMKMFEHCENLLNADLSKCNFTNVNNFTYLFYNCSSLTSVTFNEHFGENCQFTSLYYMFNGCNSLLNVDLSFLDVNKVTNYVGMFSSCSSMETIKLFKNMNIGLSPTDYNIFGNMFYNLNPNCHLITNCVYDYTPMLTSNRTSLPSTVIFSCEGQYVEQDVYIVKDGVLVTSLNEGETLTINNVEGVYNESSQTWNFYYFANDYYSEVNLNGVKVYIVALKSKVYAFFGDCSNFDAFNITATFVTSNDSSYILYNEKRDANILGVIVDGKHNYNNEINIYSKLYEDADEVTFENNLAFNSLGEIYECEGYELSDFIPIDNSTTIMWNCASVSDGKSYIIEYNENKEYIDYWSPNASPRTITLTGKENTKYMRISLKSSVKYNVYLVDETNQKYLFRGDNVQIKGINEVTGVTHTVKYIFDTENATSMAGFFQVATYNTAPCYSFKTIEFSENFNTSNITNMSTLFGNCHSIERLDISMFDTSNVTNFEHMFGRCYSLTEVIGLDKLNTSKATNLKWLFAVCRSIESIDLSNLIVDNVTTMFGMFQECAKLTTIIGMDKWNTSNVSDMDYMFSTCPLIEQSTYETIFNWDVSNLWTCEYMFYKCTSLKYFTFENWNTARLYYAAVMFCNTYNVVVEFGDNFHAPYVIDSMLNNIANVEVDLSTWVFNSQSGVSNMYNFLRDCPNLEKVTFGEQWKNIYNSTMQRCFYGCSKLKEIVGIENIGRTYKYTTSNNLAQVFEGCQSLESIDISNWAETMGYVNHHYWGTMMRGCTNLKSVNLTGWDKFTINNMDNLFANCKCLVSTDQIIGFDKLNTSETLSMYQMFQGCSALNDFNITTWDTSKVTGMHNMFDGCSSLTKLDLSSFNTSSVTNMTSMFYNCTNLSDLNISSFNTSKVTSMAHMFRGLKKMTDLDLSHLDTSSVTNMQEMFRDSNALTSLTMTNNVSKVTNVGNMFYGISTNGVLNYNCEYDYSKIINVLPGTWTPFCKGNEVTINVKLVINGVDVNQLNEGDVFTLDGNEGVYNSETSTWQFTHTPSFYLSELVYNDNKIEINNGKTITQYMIIGGLSSVSTYYSNNNQNLRIVNKIDNVSRQIIDGVEVTPVSAYTFSKQGTHEVVNIYDSENITSFSELFNGCNAMRSFKFTNFNTSNKITSTYKMFYDCKQIKTIDLSIMDTSEVTNMQEMFRHCNAATVIDTSNFNTSAVTNMSYMFHDCYEMKSFDVSNFDTSNVTNMTNMFWVCRNCKTFNVSSFNTSKVTSMNNMFYQCQVLEEIDLSNFDMSSVTNLSGMFQNCNILSSVTFNTSIEKVTNVGNLFANISTIGVLKYNCEYDFTKVINVKPSNWSLFCPNTEFTTNVVLIVNDTEITELNEDDVFTLDGVEGHYNNDTSTWQFTLIPNEWLSELIYNENTLSIPSNYSDTYYFFVGDMTDELCNLTQTIITTSENQNVKLIDSTKYIKSIMIDGVQTLNKTHHKFDTIGEHTIKYMLKDDLTNLGYMFNGCDRVSKFEFNNFNTSNVTNIERMFQNCSLVSSFDLSMLDTSKVTNMTCLFQGCRNCETFKLDDLFTTSGVTTMYGMFADCDKLNSSDLTTLDTSKVTSMAYMFQNCNTLTSLDLSTFNTSAVTDMSYMFQNCSVLTDVNLSSFDTRKVKSTVCMFNNCANMESINLTSFDTSSLNNMESMFSGCSKMTEFIVNRDTWNTSNVSNMKNTFNSCSAMTTFDATLFDTSNVTNMHGLFSRCTSLTEVDLSSWNTDKLTNMEYTFDNCFSMESIDLSSFNLSNVTTMLELFINSTNLKHVKMNGSVAKVTNVNNMFNGITTDGVFEYACPYDYSKIIAKLPSTWTTKCLEITSSIIIKVDGNEVTSLNDGDVLTVNGVDGTYNIEKQCWEFVHTPTEVKCKFIYNDYELNIVSTNLKKQTLYLGGVPSNIVNITQLITTTSENQSVKLVNKYTNVISSMYIDYAQVDVTGTYVFDEVGEHMVQYIVDMSNIKDINNMFTNCTNMNNIKFSNMNTSHITHCYYMFNNCSNLETIDMSSFDMTNIVQNYRMFQGCTKLKSVTIDSEFLNAVNYDNIFNTVGANGTLYVDCQKNNTRLTSQLPSTWTTQCIDGTETA